MRYFVGDEAASPGRQLPPCIRTSSATSSSTKWPALPSSSSLGGSVAEIDIAHMHCLSHMYPPLHKFCRMYDYSHNTAAEQIG